MRSQYQIIDVAENLDGLDEVFVTGADVFKPGHDCPNCEARVLDEHGEFCDRVCEREYYEVKYEEDDEYFEEFFADEEEG